MGNAANVRLTVPKNISTAITRQKLIDRILDNPGKLAYIHAGAGYGKTTLLAQIAGSCPNPVWFSLDHENEIFTFITNLGEAIRRVFPDFTFTSSEYLRFEGRGNSTLILADAFLSSLEKLTSDFMMILDDFHMIDSPQIKEFITCIMKYPPENMRLCVSSREAPWPGLVSLRLKGRLLELTQHELTFTKDETALCLGFADEHLFAVTEGWPLAIGSFRLLWKNKVPLTDIPASGHDGLHDYLLNECVNNLPPEIIRFLFATACFGELDPPMLNAVLGLKNAGLILENLASHNIFTIKTSNGLYRYHALFQEHLLEHTVTSQNVLLLNQAGAYYFTQNDYSRAAGYAILSQNETALQKVILTCYREYLKNGRFSELRSWFQVLDKAVGHFSHEYLVAKGAFASRTGDFQTAKQCLDAALPRLNKENEALYIEATLHKARVLRNFVSFEASSQLLDELLADNDFSFEVLYSVAIEKIYNLCWNSQIKEAYAVITYFIEKCARAGNLKVRSWFERYLTAVCFFAGRMRDTVEYYEKSLELPENERQYLDMHSIAIYAAKAYQMLGERDQAVNLIAAELQRLRTTMCYEEMWAACLLAAEIHFQNTFIDRANGGNPSYEKVVKYFTLAEEYAPLCRTTKFQMVWVKLQRLVNSLSFSANPDPLTITEISAAFDQAGDYLKTTVLARLFGYYASVNDLGNAIKYARLAIEIGEKSGIMLIPVVAYGILALASVIKQDPQAVSLTRRFLELCRQHGVYEYFRIRERYGIILQFALNQGIEPDFTEQMMRFSGFTGKKVYIETLGGFAVFPYQNRKVPLKMRSKKERELLAFLLDAGSQGATKEQIYNAIWSESESNNIQKLIGVNFAHLKNDLAGLDVANPIINHERHYRIRTDEITTDTELFEKAVTSFEQQPGSKAAQQIVTLYKGEYLSEFEALWAIPKRIKYRAAYEKALGYITGKQ